VATTVAGRSPELERVAGVFANVLPLRTSLGGNPTFAEILRRVSETTRAGLANQDYPLVLWVEELARRRGEYGLQLSSGFFTVHEEAFAPSFEGLSARWFTTNVFGTTPEARGLPWNDRQQIAFAASETGRGWRVELLGDSAAFAETSLERMLGQWIAIVRQVAGEPQRRLDDIDLLACDGATYGTAALDRDEIEHLFA
jgi:non-ribosomal peptide synthetase component F